MYDIRTDELGSPTIDSGGFVAANRSQFILQQLYRTVMNFNLRAILGPNVEQIQDMKDALQYHLHQSFVNSIDIDPNDITVTAREGKDKSHVEYGILYTGINEMGVPDTVEFGTTYSASTNGVVSINYNQDYLSEYRNPKSKDISFWTTIEEPTSHIMIPTPPYENIANIQGLPYVSIIHLLMEGETGMETNEETVTIPITPEEINYQIAGFLDHYTPRLHSIMSTDIIESTVNYNIRNELLDPVITAIDQEGAIIVKIKYIKAVALTQNYTFMHNNLNLSTFKLKPNRRYIYAVFPKSVIPGRYMVKYTGIEEN